ncbi:TPA: hypothetical protein JTJ55_004059 [Escherichia coli]|nr:hypothetical protein [Escherichia coli]HAL9141309.1 hypothetical protein [Escherichia coli]HAL9265775.1 hypothetical protein [Escherichia coli]HAL9353010.1 hypothetical protein [Escherichia coli]HAV7670753.1 hypothetical protein [Escherichia coli]
MNYRYRAMTQDGQKLQGIIDANDERQARLRLREEGLFLLDIRPQKSSGVKTRRPRISHSELTLFTRQLATLSAAALPLEESLAVIGQQSSNNRLADVLNQVRSAILEGHPLSDALQHFPTLFDSLYRTLVKAGEKSGLLAPVLEKLADYNENRQKIRRKLIQSLIYPCMLTTVAIVVVIILLTAVVPKITEQFVHMKQQLPLSTRILLGLSDTLQRTGPTLLATVFIVAVGFWLWLKRGNNRHRFHAMLLRVALIGPLICAINSARYLRTLSILQSSGVPLLDGMNLSTESLNNLEIRQRLANAAENVRQVLVHFWQKKYAWHDTVPLILCVAAAIACALAPFTPIVTGALFLYFCFALTLSVIDFRTQLLPDKLTLPLLWLGLVFNAQSGLIDLHDAVYGAVAGYGVLWCVYWGVWLVCHKEGLGYGDFKLLAAAGAWCGWQTLPMILLIASLGGIGYAIVSQLLQRRTITTIAFGPWLAFGSMINLGYLAWISY